MFIYYCSLIIDLLVGAGSGKEARPLDPGFVLGSCDQQHGREYHSSLLAVAFVASRTGAESIRSM